MFERNAQDYDASPDQIEEVWNKMPDVQAFWLAEATAVLDFIGFAKAVQK